MPYPFSEQAPPLPTPPPSLYLQLQVEETNEEMHEAADTEFYSTEGAAFFQQEVGRWYLQKEVAGGIKFGDLSPQDKRIRMRCISR